jgi:aspartate kinase
MRRWGWSGFSRPIDSLWHMRDKLCMHVRVYKFGGASLADIEKLKSVALFLKKEKEKQVGPILAVVSAMGKTTDELIALAKKVTGSPQRRELDMLLTVGERTSMSLMSLALNDLGVKAISFTGSQAGILTDNAHGNARIIETRPFRIEDHLKNGDTVVLAGFQGVSQANKEITTLGRGGTDTTAIAMASHFQSQVCEFKKDVGGIFTADPKIVPQAQHLPHLSFKNLVDMTFWGGKFLHYRAAELALVLKLPLRFSHFQNENEFTLVNGDPMSLEQQKVLSINSHKDVYEWSFLESSLSEALVWIQKKVQEQSLPTPQILTSTDLEKGCKVLFVGELGEMATHLQLPGTCRKLSTVTATCQGAVSSELLSKCLKTLNNISPLGVLQDTTNLTFVVKPSDRENTIQRLHALIH